MNAGHWDRAGTAPTAERGRFDSTVQFNRQLCREHFLLRLRVAGCLPPTRPGQFVQLGCRPPDSAIDGEVLRGRPLAWPPDGLPPVAQPELRGRLAFLRRPFSLAGRGEEGPDTWVEVIGRVVGTGTGWLGSLQPEDRVDLIGPLGNWFRLPDDRCLGLLVGGGVGLPPMFYLAQALRAEGWDAIAFVGALSRDLLAVTFAQDIEPNPQGLPTLCVRQFAGFNYPTVITTDDGSCGLRGRITAGLKGVLDGLSMDMIEKTVVFTCGPDRMMRQVAHMAETCGVACQVCLEQAMACGMSTCQSCVVRIDPRKYKPDLAESAHGSTPDGRPWRYRLACTDGPVFASTQVVW